MYEYHDKKNKKFWEELNFYFSFIVILVSDMTCRKMSNEVNKLLMGLVWALKQY
jgi:hypothetical protein